MTKTHVIEERLLQFISDYSNKYRAFPTFKQISIEVGISTTSVNYYLQRFVSRKILGKERRPGTKRQHFYYYLGNGEC